MASQKKDTYMKAHMNYFSHHDVSGALFTEKNGSGQKEILYWPDGTVAETQMTPSL